MNDENKIVVINQSGMQENIISSFLLRFHTVDIAGIIKMATAKSIANN